MLDREEEMMKMLHELKFYECQKCRNITCTDEGPLEKCSFCNGEMRELKQAQVTFAPKKKSEWIPVSTRKATKEEIEEAAPKMYLTPEELDGTWMYCCQLPEDGQEVLVTTKWGVALVEFTSDEYGCVFDGYEDEGDVLAWMPLPEPYKKDEQNDA